MDFGTASMRLDFGRKRIRPPYSAVLLGIKLLTANPARTDFQALKLEIGYIDLSNVCHLMRSMFQFTQANRIEAKKNDH